MEIQIRISLDGIPRAVRDQFPSFPFVVDAIGKTAAKAIQDEWGIAREYTLVAVLGDADELKRHGFS